MTRLDFLNAYEDSYLNSISLCDDRAFDLGHPILTSQFFGLATP
jgi:hypothetical protein